MGRVRHRLEGLIDVAALSAGQVVLVPAASSSVGLAAIQIARKVGAIPVALTRTSTKPRCATRELLTSSPRKNKAC
jgi:NADPH:quinone reductase-like Zn-dependent oxidoreductase